MTLSTGAIAALRQLAKTDHTSETVFYGYAGDPPIKTPEFRELAFADLAKMQGRMLRLTDAGRAKVAALNSAFPDETDPLRARFHEPVITPRMHVPIEEV